MKLYQAWQGRNEILKIIYHEEFEAARRVWPSERTPAFQAVPSGYMSRDPLAFPTLF